jgi:hypothetical protein
MDAALPLRYGHKQQSGTRFSHETDSRFKN